MRLSRRRRCKPLRVVHGNEILTTLEELVSPAQTAVLVVNMQNEFVSPDGGFASHGFDVPRVRAIIPNIQRLLFAARAAGVLVAYAEQIHRSSVGTILADGIDYYSYSHEKWAPCVQEGTSAAKTVDELTPQAVDLVFPKVKASAFVGTPLDRSLRARGIRSIVLTGTSVQGCLVQTHYESHQAGYYLIVARDAVAPYGVDETLLPQLVGFGDQFDTDEIVAMWSK